MSVLVNSGGAKLIAEVAGYGRPILLIHGWPLDHRTFTPQVPALSKHLKVIVYDRRGFGRSEGKPDLRLELDDIDSILDELADEPVHLLGMSQGGRIALRYSVTRPERLRSLILQAPVVDGLAISETEEERIPIDEYAELAREGRLDEVRQLWLRHPNMAISDQHAEAKALLEQMLQDYSGADLLDFSPESYDFPRDVLGGTAELRVPTLILTGIRETASRREHANRVLETIPGVQEVIFHDSGHLSNLTEAARYNQVVINFCKRVDSTTSPSNDRPQD